MTITSKVERITPQMAERWLDKNDTGNRTLRQHKVNQYARAMIEGRWALNGETIQFGSDGMLKNGQHRLWACLEAKVPFDCLVVRNVAPETFATIDTGLARDHGTIASMAGYKNAAATVAAARWINALESGRAKKASGHAQLTLSPDEVLELIKRYGEPLIHSVDYCARSIHRQVGFASAFAAVHFMVGRNFPDEADLFIHRCGTGEGLQAGDPELALRERLTRRHLSRDPSYRLKSVDGMNLIIKAWNARIAGRKVKSVGLGKMQAGAAMTMPITNPNRIRAPELADLTQ